MSAATLAPAAPLAAAATAAPLDLGSLPGSDTAPPADPPRAPRLQIRTLALMVTAFVGWSAMFPLDIASHSQGEVVVAGQVKTVQHLEGGIVRKLLVKEGQTVREGEALAEIERTASDADLNELDALIGGLQIRILRLEAQQSGRSGFDVPPELAKRLPEQVRTARELFESQRQRLSSSLEVQGTKISQREAESKELLARQDQLVGKIKLLREQITISDKLLKEGLTNQYEHLNLLKEEQATVGALNETRASLGRIAAGRQQESAALRSLASGDREQTQKDLADARKQLAEMQERRLKFTDSQSRTVIRAPMDGTVMTMNIVTEGGVLNPGGALLTLVPGGGSLLVEAQLPIGDVGLIKPGQAARIQLASATARGFQPMNAEVVEISPDAVAQPNKERYYRVRLKPEKPAFEYHARRYALAPGVAVQVSILAGERSVLAYVFDPLTRGLGEAMTEP